MQCMLKGEKKTIVLQIAEATAQVTTLQKTVSGNKPMVFTAPLKPPNEPDLNTACMMHLDSRRTLTDMHKHKQTGNISQ